VGSPVAVPKSMGVRPPLRSKRVVVLPVGVRAVDNHQRLRLRASVAVLIIRTMEVHIATAPRQSLVGMLSVR